jgi:hypothetical protein
VSPQAFYFLTVMITYLYSMKSIEHQSARWKICMTWTEKVPRMWIDLKSGLGRGRFCRLVALCVALVLLCSSAPAFAIFRRIDCRIESMRWDVTGARLVRTSIGPFECSEFVRHTITSKVVKKRVIG